MEWVALSAVLWVAVLVAGLRVVQRRRARRSLCRNCQYDYLDVCQDPRRPRATECDVYLPIEEEALEEDEEDAAPADSGFMS